MTRPVSLELFSSPPGIITFAKQVVETAHGASTAGCSAALVAISHRRGENSRADRTAALAVSDLVVGRNPAPPHQRREQSYLAPSVEAS